MVARDEGARFGGAQRVREMRCPREEFDGIASIHSEELSAVIAAFSRPGPETMRLPR